MVNLGTELMGNVTKLYESHGTRIVRVEKGHHRSLAFVNSFHNQIEKRLFKGMQKKELIANRINKEWVKALQPTITAMNNETTRLTGLKPAEAILLDLVPLKSRPIAPEVDILPLGTMVRYILTNDDFPLRKRRATDYHWSKNIFPIIR